MTPVIRRGSSYGMPFGYLVQYLPKYDFLSVLDPGVSERELARVVSEVVSAKMPCRWSSYFVMCLVR